MPDTQSDSRRDRPAFLPSGFDTLDELLPPVVDESGTTTYRDIEIASPIGFRPLRMDLQIPITNGQVPVVLYIHGGAFMFGSRLRGAVSEPIRTSLLRRGLAAASVEYRLSGEARFPACLHDVTAAVRWLRRFGPALGLRSDAVGAWGESAGAHLAVFLGLNSTDPALNGNLGFAEAAAEVQAVVAWYPPTRFLTMDTDAPADAAMSHDAPNSPESLLVGGPIQENPEAAAFASPISHVGPNAAPMLLVHGLEDRLVPYPQSVALQRALEAVGAEARLISVPGAGHVFEGVDVAPIAEQSATYLAERLS
jgi:acetyl esterase/lipase